MDLAYVEDSEHGINSCSPRSTDWFWEGIFCRYGLNSEITGAPSSEIDCCGAVKAGC